MESDLDNNNNDSKQNQVEQYNIFSFGMSVDNFVSSVMASMTDIFYSNHRQTVFLKSVEVQNNANDNSDEIQQNVANCIIY